MLDEVRTGVLWMKGAMRVWAEMMSEREGRWAGDMIVFIRI
jgi:hypothetical protein